MFHKFALALHNCSGKWAALLFSLRERVREGNRPTHMCYICRSVCVCVCVHVCVCELGRIKPTSNYVATHYSSGANSLLAGTNSMKAARVTC